MTNMRYVLDEGWPYDFARLLNTRHYPGANPLPVHTARDLGFYGRPDPKWVEELGRLARSERQQWTVVTRDRMRQHRPLIFATPLTYAILNHKTWGNASLDMLQDALLRHWPSLARQAARTRTGVFTIAFHTGKPKDYQPPGQNRP